MAPAPASGFDIGCGSGTTRLYAATLLGARHRSQRLIGYVGEDWECNFEQPETRKLVTIALAVTALNLFLGAVAQGGVDVRRPHCDLEPGQSVTAKSPLDNH